MDIGFIRYLLKINVHKYCNNKTYNSGKTFPQIWHFLSPEGSMIKCLILYISSIPSDDVVYNKKINTINFNLKNITREKES